MKLPPPPCAVLAGIDTYIYIYMYIGIDIRTGIDVDTRYKIHIDVNTPSRVLYVPLELCPGALEPI